MAQTSRPGDKSAVGMAESRELHQGKKHSGDSSRTNRRRHITAEQKQRIRDLYETTKNGHEVARMMGLGSTTVYRHLELKKCKKPLWTDEDDQIVVDGYAEKRSVKEIARAIGRSNRAVVLHMCRHRKKIREDPKKRRVMGVMTYVLRVMRKSDIFRELEEAD